MDTRELLQQVDLVDVRLIQRVAELRVDPNPNHGVGLLEAESGKGADVDDAPETTIDINAVSWGRTIEIWFRIKASSAVVKMAAAVATMYERETDEDVPEEVRIEFIEKVAVMAAYPYLRAEMQALAADLRLGNLTLGILPQGGFKVQRHEGDIKSEDEFL